MPSTMEDRPIETLTSMLEAKPRQGLERYFFGPRDTARHSKWPRALRMHGSVTPRILLRVAVVGAWAAFVGIISEEVHRINVHPIVTTVLGVLVGFALNVRSSSAYERYMEGRKCWSALTGVSTSLARSIWIHVQEREGDMEKQDLLAKVTFLNMIIAFAIALKHRLRFEPYIQYSDLYNLVSHMDTLAKSAGTPTVRDERPGFWRYIFNVLHVAEENPRAELKRATRPLGNLPSELLSHMFAFVNEATKEGILRSGSMESKILDSLRALDDILVTSDRILNTPLPIAYTIAISQITWLFIICLPIQLVHLMGWVSIPVTLLSAYIILGFAAIGNEIENPFGLEVNDLPLEIYCAQIASEIAIITTKPAPKFNDYVTHPDNNPLYPVNTLPAHIWPNAPMADIRSALKDRAFGTKTAMLRKQSVNVAMDRKTSVDTATTLNEAEDPERGLGNHEAW